MFIGFICSVIFSAPCPNRVSVEAAWGEKPMHNFSHATTPSGFLPDPQVLIGELGDVIPPACHAPWSARKNTSRRRGPGASLTDA